MGFGRRLVGWIAAYAFVLHAVLAGAVATELAANTATGAFELCVAGTDGSPPSGHHSQHENCAIHCATVAGGVPLLALALGLLFPPRAAPRRSRFAFHPVTDFFRRAGYARAPPRPA